MTDWLGALRQTERWTTKDGRVLALEDMTPDHRTNLVAMYHRQANTLKWAHDSDSISLVYSMDIEPSNGILDELDHWIDEDPHVWLDRQPLIKRLRELNGTAS